MNVWPRLALNLWVCQNPSNCWDGCLSCTRSTFPELHYVTCLCSFQNRFFLFPFFKKNHTKKPQNKQTSRVPPQFYFHYCFISITVIEIILKSGTNLINSKERQHWNAHQWCPQESSRSRAFTTSNKNFCFARRKSPLFCSSRLYSY